MNIIKAIETQKAAGRKVEGIVVKVSLPNNPRARLTSFENGQAVFEEILPNSRSRIEEPRQWVVTNDNHELVHYELNPNSKVVPTAEFGESGLVVNGQHVDTGDLDVRAVVAVAPNTVFLQVGDLVDKYTANVMIYDVQRDKFKTRNIKMPIETKTIVLPNTQDGATRTVLFSNRYTDKVKNPDENGEGDIVKVYDSTEYTAFLNGESTGRAVVDATAPIIDAFSVEGDDTKIVFVLQGGIERVDEAKIVPEGEPKRAECYMTSFEFPTGNEYESLTVPIVATTKAVCCGRHQVYTFFGADEAYVVDTDSDSDIPPVTLGGDVAKAVFDHPYYCGTRTKYDDEDGNIGYVYAYTDGKEVVRFVVRHTDRGIKGYLV